MSLKDLSGSSETRNTPAPYRAIYGFVLWIISYVFLIIYIVWAFVPEEWLHVFGLTYWPQKYWAVAIPAYIFFGLLLFGFVIYPSINLLITPPLNDFRTVTDEDATFSAGKGIAPITDVPLVDVCEKLYL
ncbi:hypothetical protein GHT06_014208 [Daphnia sinensis]|uniref:Phosphatidylinositol N-acetylglucosaminyltransferase subunit P n=1 Tax=Daphnia sinensis TaxID=1820382 RepID=A0AAD5KT81_9CRUS|nr:hypothetical protein GHT06_014208 [Daphnia sinensis]